MSLNIPHLGECFHLLYPLEHKDITETRRSASFLDFFLDIDTDWRLKTILWQTLYDFNFQIVSFTFLSTNIPSAPLYCIYISQLIFYACTCLHYMDFINRGVFLTLKLLHQSLEEEWLKLTLHKFYGHHHKLVGRFEVDVSQLTTNMIWRSLIFKYLNIHLIYYISNCVLLLIVQFWLIVI